MRSNLMLLMAATIWGMGFVAQRLGMDHMGPYTFNGLRFLLGALSLLPLLWWLKSRQPVAVAGDHRQLLTGGVLAGLVLFCAASLQQVGLLYTTAAKAGFITGLYIILVPVLGLLLRHKSGLNTWIGALIALSGLYVLSVTDEFTIGFGDLLQVAGALFWAIHLLLVDHYSNRVAPIKLAGVQFVVCGLRSAQPRHRLCHRNPDCGWRRGRLAGAALCRAGVGRGRLYPAGGGAAGCPSGPRRHHPQSGDRVCRRGWRVTAGGDAGRARHRRLRPDAGRDADLPDPLEMVVEVASGQGAADQVNRALPA